MSTVSPSTRRDRFDELALLFPEYLNNVVDICLGDIQPASQWPVVYGLTSTEKYLERRRIFDILTASILRASMLGCPANLKFRRPQPLEKTG